jgi:hypothetical protein
MSTIKSLYGSNNQAITCTITSLGSTNARSSAAIDNTSNLFLDALVTVKVKTANTGVATGYVNVYAYGTTDGGTTYGGGEVNMGTDAGVTLTSPPNIVLIGVLNAPATTATTYVLNAKSVAAGFGGILPDHWGIVVENKTGATLDASVGSAWYQGVQAQVI